MPGGARRVFITGALGFIGRALGERFAADGAEVTGVDLVADPARAVVAGDVAEPGPWQAEASGADLVIHTAAAVSNAIDADTAWRANVLATRRALDAARDGGAGRFVLFSSVRAFSDLGFPDGVEESWPVRPDGNPYVDTKIAAEQVALQAHAAGEVAATIVRPGDVYGPRSRPWTVLPLEAIQSGRFLLPAMGRGVFSPVFVDDLVAGARLAATSEGGAGRVFTIGGAEPTTCREFFSHYYRMLGRRGPPVAPTSLAVRLAQVTGALERARGNQTEVNGQTMRYLARRGSYSIATARSVLGYAPVVGLAEGMRRTEEWLREEGLLPAG